MAVPEIFADVTVRLTVSKDGSLGKLMFASRQPALEGQMETTPVLVLTMPVSALQALSSDIVKALDAVSAAPPARKN
jgi:hypothetical protein